MQLTIDKLVYGGDGLARTSEGEVLFVPWSAPGDVVEAQKMAGSVKPPRAKLESLLTASADRVEPTCSVFGTCGGCQWQHLSIESQRLWKRNIVEESLRRIGKLPDVPVLDTIGSDPSGWESRNRVQWEIELAGDSFSEKPAYRLGYYQAQSHDVVEFDRCHVMPGPLNTLAAGLRHWAQENPTLASGLLRVEAMISPEQDILLVLEGENNAQLKGFAEDWLTRFPQVKGICHKDPAKKQASPRLLAGHSALRFSLAGKQYQVSAGSFFQTSYAGAEKLLSVLDQWLPEKSASLLDLYAGVGLFSIHFHDRASVVMAIESSKSALADAQESLTLNEILNVALHPGDARQVMRQLKQKFEVAILDPPRSGCQPEVLDWLSTHVTQQLLYVSCNPTTLARDVKTLVANGWKLEVVQPIDMFPHTYHVESIAKLTR